MIRKIVPLVFACSLVAVGGLRADGLDTAGFRYRQTITFSGYAGASSLTDFPALVKLPKRHFHTLTYGDVFFSDGEGNPLAYEVDSATGDSVLFWVKLPVLTGHATSVTAWFGRASSFPAAYPSTDVWSRYVGVWHFNYESPDSTAHALPYKTENASAVDDNGLLGRGFKYEAATANGTGVLAQTPHAYLTDAAQFSISGWFKPASSTPSRATRLLAWKADHFRPGLDTFQNTNGKLYIRGDSDKYQKMYPLDWSAEDWSHLVVCAESADFLAYLNGQEMGNAETSGTPSAPTFTDANNVGWIGFGNMGGFADGTYAGDFAYPFKGGEVDELRVYDGLMTEDWAAAEYATVADHHQFTAYGNLEEFDVEVVDRDGVWVAEGATADWSDVGNWRDGLPLSGASSTLYFSSPASVATQTVSLGDMVGLGAIVQDDAVRRTVVDGRFAFADTADVTVNAGELILADGLAANALDKKGTGILALPCATSLLGVSVQGGELAYRAPAGTVQGAAFTAEGTVYVTHLGVADGAATARVDLSSVTHVEATETTEASDVKALVAQTRFAEAAPGLLRDGFRYLRLPQPIALKAGTDYEVVCDDGREARAIVSSFLPEQRILGTLDVAEGAVFKMETPSVTVQGLTGAGTVAAGTEPSVLAVSVAAGAEDRFAGTVAPGPIALRKEGDGTLRVGGTGLFADGVYVKKGTLLLASPDTIAPQAPIAFNDFTGGNAAGVLSVEGTDVTISNPFHALKMSSVGMSAAGVRALPGQTLTVADTSVMTPDADVQHPNGRQTGEFAVHAFADAAGNDPTLVFRSNTVAYVDFIARVDGLQDSLEVRPNNAVVLDTLLPTTKLRKLVVQNNARRSLGGTVTITGGNTLTTDYLDFTGAQLKAKLAGGTTLVAPNLRLADSTPNWETIDECNVDLTVEEGSVLAAKGFPAPGTTANTRNCTNTVLRLDGGTFQVTGLTADSDIFPSVSIGQPVVELTEKGGTIDLRPYGGGEEHHVTAKSPIRSAEGAAETPLVIRGGSLLPTFTVDADMTYAGPTTLDSATLRLNKRLRAGSDLALVNGSKIFFTPSDEAFSTQSYGTLSSDGAAPSIVNTASGELQFRTYRNVQVTKKGAGTLGIVPGLTADPVMDNASVTVTEGTFRIGGITGGEAAMELVADGSFEPSPALPQEANNRAPNDKRGTRDAAYLASALPTWTFAGGNGSGICSSVSYFSEASQFAGEPEGNRHCAFLFVKDGNAGEISRTFEVTQDESVFELEYRVASRYYGGKVYPVRLFVMVDGEAVDTYPEADAEPVQNAQWTTRQVALGRLGRGTHTLSFTSPNDDSLGVLIDEVKLGSYTIACGDHVRGLSLDLLNGAKLELDFNGQIEAQGIRVDGKTVYGHINAQTHAQFVTGRGTLYVKGGGCIVIFR